MYTIDELIKAAKRFGYSPVLVEAALRVKGKENLTLEEAQQIIDDFAKLEVKD